MPEIPASAVRKIGDVLDVKDRRVSVGADCDTVTLQIAYGLVARLDAAQRDQFMRLYFEAERAAEAWAKEHAGAGEAEEPCSARCGYVSHGQDLIEHMRYEHVRCTECGNEPVCAHSVSHKPDCPRLQPGYAYPAAVSDA